MAKILILISLLLVSLNAFSIYQTVVAMKSNELKSIPWPFTVCGKGKWTPESLSLGAVPARNTNDDITFVKFSLFSLELQMMTPHSLLLILKLNLMESSSTLNRTLLLPLSVKETLSNTNSPTLSLVSLPQELMDSPLDSKLDQPKMAVQVSVSNFDLIHLSFDIFKLYKKDYYSDHFCGLN